MGLVHDAMLHRPCEPLRLCACQCAVDWSRLTVVSSLADSTWSLSCANLVSCTAPVWPFS